MQLAIMTSEAWWRRPPRRLGSLWIGILAMTAFLFLGADARAAGGPNIITSPDSAFHALFISLALDGAGNPVVSYYDGLPDVDLKLVHCNDPNCFGGDESITSPDTAGEVGEFSSLQLDSAGYPVVSYYDRTNDDLKVLHCNDSNCAGGDESVTTPDPGASGGWTSLELDAAGNPVVSYFDGGGLKLLHCNDPNCAGGDESITSQATTGQYSSLELDATGNPVVSYGGGQLRLLHCNDPNCAGGDESITTQDATGGAGAAPSLSLDGSGYPVVSYTNFLTEDLLLLHCNDANCVGGDDSITTPDAGTDVASGTSLQLDASGNPLVSYSDGASNELKLLHCNDPDCAAGGDSITVPNSTGFIVFSSSLRLDGSGNPIVAYHDPDAAKVKLLHCGNPNCADAVGGVAELPDAERVVVTSRTSSGFGAAPLAVLAAAATAAVFASFGIVSYLRRRPAT